jgi:signal peptide peptidase SppA
MDHSNIIATLNEPWASTEANYRGFLAKVQRMIRAPIAEEAAARSGARAGDGVQMAGRTAIVPIIGTLVQRASAFEKFVLGAVSTEEIGATLARLADDSSVGKVVLLLDSPGGSVFGIEELGAQIRSMTKPTSGIANPIAASAGYWLLSQTKSPAVSPSGSVGSLGVIAAHEDASRMFEELLGIRVTLVTAGKFKGENNPFEPLNNEGRAELQNKVDGYYAKFVGAVARGRGVSVATVESQFGQGRMFLANEAVRAGLVDRVATMEDFLAGEGAPRSVARAVASKMETQINRRLTQLRADEVLEEVRLGRHAEIAKMLARIDIDRRRDRAATLAGC